MKHRLKLLLAGLIGLCLPATAETAAKETYLYGSLIYSSAWGAESRPYGIYSMPLSAPDDLQAVQLNGSLNANAGGVYYDGKYCFVNFFETFGAITAYYYVYDANTWERISSNRVPNTSISTDLTYDPVTRQIFGCFLNGTNDGYVFGSMEASTGAVTAISNLNAPFFCIAASPEGEIFGVQGDGYLYRIDKSTGSWSKIGSTGVIPLYSQSATFDRKTGKLYWAACSESSSGLYEVDTTTGRATLLQRFTDTREFGGLYIPDPEATDKAPNAVSDLTVEYITTTASDLRVSFTMPTTTYDGSPLTGEVDYTVIIDGVDQYIETAQAGEKVSFTLNNPKSGKVTVGIATSTDSGRGPTRKVTLWVGKDAPKAVTDIRFTVSGSNVVNLSWTAPTEGINGGYVNPEKLTYKIVRRPDNKIVADGFAGTAFTDNTGADRLSYFYYDITAQCDGLTGETAGTGKVVVGNAKEIPYLEQFNSSDDFELFTVIDANNDGRTWAYDYMPRAYCTYSSVNTMDDWLITPPIQLSNDRLYKLTFSAYASDFTEMFNVCLGDAATVEAMTMELVPTSTVKNMTPKTITALIRVSESKSYHIGIHKTSPADRSSLYIDDISIVEDAKLEAPGAATELQAVAGEKGALTATISFKAPAVTVGGGLLSGISNIYLYRDSQIIKNFKASEVEPGAMLTYVDDTAPQGLSTYKVVARNDAGNGLEATTETFVGIDAPGLPQNVRLIELDGRAHISWEAPITGTHGGYFDPDNLTYLIAAPAGEDLTVIHEDYDGNSIDVTVDLATAQQSVFFYVFAKSTGGLSQGMYTNSVIMGTPYDLPFNESFAGSYPAQDWHVEVPRTGYWQTDTRGVLPTADAQDLDSGLVSFMPEDTGDEGFLYTGKLSTFGSTNPTLEFYYYNVRGTQNRLEVKVTDNGADWQVAKTIALGDTEFGNGWKQCSISLKDFATTGFMQVGFHAYNEDGITSIHLDNIAIRQVYEHDLAVDNIFAPSALGVGNQAAISVQVSNRGANASGNYDVVLYRDGLPVATQGGTQLAPGGRRTFSFPQTADKSLGEQVTYRAVVKYAADQFTSNNDSKTVNMQITRPARPAVSDLAATTEGSAATLTWSTPAYNSTCDGFESYSPFAINSFGDWTTIDADGSETATVTSYTWPNAGMPQAWIVFDPVSLDMAYEDDGSPSMFAPKDGDKMLVSFSASNGKDDDWLISPPLNGKAQTVTFYIKSCTDFYGFEEYQFLTSKSRALNLSTFEVVEENHNVPIGWTKMSFDLEEGTVYFAIRNIGQMKYALCIDDVTFAPASMATTQLQGFNVYCNGNKLTETPITANSYVYDGIKADESYTFTVTAVYNEGESAHSNVAVVGESGIKATVLVTAEVYGRRGEIVIEGCEDSTYKAFSADGTLIAFGTTHGTTHIAASPGIYIVAVDSSVRKVIVK